MESLPQWMGLLFPLTIGVVSGLSHCAAMCGPIHLALNRRSRVGEMQVFHLGRIATYLGLGALAGAVGYSWESVTEKKYTVVLWIVVYLILGLRILGIKLWPAHWGVAFSRWVWKNSSLISPQKQSGNAANYFPMGMASGLLPCATTHAGLAWAANTGDALWGTLGMGLLGLGTLPLFLLFSPKIKVLNSTKFHALLGVALLALAGWKTYGLFFAESVSCH